MLSELTSRGSAPGLGLVRGIWCAGFAGAVSRSATAPVDRLKMLLMVEETPQAKGMRWGLHRMAAEGGWGVVWGLAGWAQCGCVLGEWFVCCVGSFKSFFKGNGTNVVKIVPENAIKLTGSDVLKPYIVQNLDDIQPLERFVCGAMAGAAAQVLVTGDRPGERLQAEIMLFLLLFDRHDHSRVD